jgi:hypothetical protein
MDWFITGLHIICPDSKIIYTNLYAFNLNKIQRFTGKLLRLPGAQLILSRCNSQSIYGKDLTAEMRLIHLQLSARLVLGKNP